MSALDIFARLCAIPHRSYHTQEMFAFLCAECERLGFVVATDAGKNIYATRFNKASKLVSAGRPKVCLQAHYDMVGVGRAQAGEPLELFRDGQYLRAQESSLGADNGAAIAAILWLMEQEKYRDVIEVLFTNDEEVGLCGANTLTIPIQAPFLLNLDSEFFGEIIVGCAGGFDIDFIFNTPKNKENKTKNYKNSTKANVSTQSCQVPTTTKTESNADSIPCGEAIYEICAFGFVGGHSGVDIHKDIPSSIVEFAHLLEVLEAFSSTESIPNTTKNLSSGFDTVLYALQAGEKANSIPTGLRALVGVESFKRDCTLESIAIHLRTHGYKVKLESKQRLCIAMRGEYGEYGFFITDRCALLNRVEPSAMNSEEFIYTVESSYDGTSFFRLIKALQHGIAYALPEHPHIVLSSLNIAMIKSSDEGLLCTLKARANTKELLSTLEQRITQTIEYFLEKTSKIRIYNFYAPWQRQLQEHHPILQLISDAFKWRNVEVGEIHAGLECGILQQRFEKMGLPPVLMASIGPTILYPHSTKERMDIGSFEEFVEVLSDIIKRLNNANI